MKQTAPVGCRTPTSRRTRTPSPPGSGGRATSTRSSPARTSCARSRHSGRYASSGRVGPDRKLTGQGEHFITDILSDANGVNFHRFQIAVWTLVLAIIFIKEVYENLENASDRCEDVANIIEGVILEHG